MVSLGLGTTMPRWTTGEDVRKQSWYMRGIITHLGELGTVRTIKLYIYVTATKLKDRVIST